MSVLAHVVFKKSSKSLQAEPVATQSLAYILNAHQEIAQSFVEMFGVADIEFEPTNIRAELRHEDGRPDITISDDQGNVRAFVENKFWAGFSDAQPVAYLDELSPEIPTALMFIVPQERMTTVWVELKRRCIQAELEWEDGEYQQNIIWSTVDGKILMITSWTHVLNGLLAAAHSGGHDSIRCDILQLQGLASREDLEAFLPIRADELTDQETARRLINYSDLIRDITQILKGNGLADTKDLRAAHSWHFIGQNLRVHQRFKLWLGIDFRSWCNAGVTPLWCILHVDDFPCLYYLQEIKNLFAEVQHDQYTVRIPIRLKSGVEQNTVVDDAVQQMTQIAELLLEIFPDNH